MAIKITKDVYFAIIDYNDMIIEMYKEKAQAEVALESLNRIYSMKSMYATIERVQVTITRV